MRRLLSVIAVLALSAFAYLPSNTPAIAAPARQTLNLLGAVVDADHPVGSVDPYTDVTIDGGQTWNPAIISRLHPWTTVAGTNAWINCISNNPADTLGSCSNSLPVHALFRYRFYVPRDFANATITGHIDVDNYGYLYFNGMDAAHKVVGPIAGGGDTFIPETSIQSMLVAGWNAMYVDLEDLGGLSGINYNLTIGIDSESPMTLAQPGSQINFDAQGGTVDPAQKTVAPGAFLSTISFPTPTRLGHSFDGWFTAASGGQEATSTFAQATKPTNDMTLYARWTKLTYNIVYEEQGGSSVADDSYQIGDVTTLPSAPTKEGYTFAGWFPSSTGGSAFGATDTQAGAGTVTYWAQWTPIDYPVTFDTQGGTTVSDSSYQIGATITLPPAPVKPGYKFLGWFQQASGANSLGTNFATTGTGALTFYAQWEQLPADEEQETTDSSVQRDLANTGSNEPLKFALFGLLMIAAAGAVRLTRR